MTISGFLWVDLVTAAVLVAWVIVRYPNLGPRSITWAVVCVLLGATAPKIALAALPLVLRLPHGLQIALLGVVLPVFFVMFLTMGWLIRACAGALGGPRGGHRVRSAAASRA